MFIEPLVRFDTTPTPVVVPLLWTVPVNIFMEPLVRFDTVVTVGTKVTVPLTSSETDVITPAPTTVPTLETDETNVVVPSIILTACVPAPVATVPDILKAPVAST